MSVVLFQGKVGRTALMWSAWNGHLDVTRLLIDRGCDKEATTVCEIVSSQTDITRFGCLHTKFCCKLDSLKKMFLRIIRSGSFHSSYL